MINRAYLIYVTGDFPRPDAEEVYVIYQEDGVIIPWPEGLTMQDALLEWARSMIDEEVK